MQSFASLGVLFKLLHLRIEYDDKNLLISNSFTLLDDKTE